MKYFCQNGPELLPRHTVDDEVDGAVEDSQVASNHVHQDLPLWPEILTSRRIKAIHHQTVPEMFKLFVDNKYNLVNITTLISQTNPEPAWEG